MSKHLSALITIVVILVSFLSPPSFVAQELTPRAYLPLVMYGVRPPTSDQLIDEALERGEIDSETALTYKVFAAFGDARLPAVYQGDDQSLVDSHIVAEVLYRYDSLSAATQAILNPFLIPPAYEGSWAEPLPAAASLSPQAARREPPPCGVLAWTDWTYKDGAHARVWWRKANKENEAKADAFIASLDFFIWPALTALMGHEPLSDALVSCSGGSEKLDIYLDSSIAKSTAPSHSQPGCKETPAYIVLNPGRPNSILAHEFMHTIQWGYKPLLGCVFPGEYAWLVEATAQWAMDYVYPKDNIEHRTAAWFFRRIPEPYLELTNKEHEYGAYLFFLYLVRSLKDPGLVKRAWDKTAGMDSLGAVNDAIPGGFESVWAQFARDNVNVPPFDYYKQWDGLTVRPISFDSPKSVMGAGTWRMSANVPHLGLVYQRFIFSGDNARLVTFFNGLTTQLSEGPLTDIVDWTPIDDGSQRFIFSNRAPEQIKGAKVQAVFKIEDDDQWKWEDWTDKQYVSFCRDVKAERLEELVIIFSNSEYQDRGYWVRPPDQAPTIMVSDMGCWRYKGTATAEMTTIGQGGSIRDFQWVDDLVFERIDAHPNIPYPFLSLRVQGGQWHRSYKITSGCTADHLEEKMLGGTQGSWLWPITGATSGPSVGRYLGLASANETLAVWVTCPEGSGYIIEPDMPFFQPSVRGRYLGRNFYAGVGGAMNETVTIWEGSGKIEDTWTLIPQREP